MKKRIFSLLLCLALALSLLPAAANAAGATTYYSVRVGGEYFTSERLTIPFGSGTATLDMTTDPYTLTLDNVQVKTTYQSANQHCIFATCSLSIVVHGDNTLDAWGSSIYVTNGNVTLSGDGKLTLKAAKAGVYIEKGNISVSGDLVLDVNVYTLGFYAVDGSVTLDNNKDATIVGGKDFFAIRAKNELTLSGAGNMRIEAGAGIRSDTSSVVISGSGDLTIVSNAETKTDMPNAAISSAKDLILSGSGSLDASGKDCCVIVRGNTGKLRLDGTSKRIALSTDGEYPAVLNYDTKESPVAGSNLAHYSVTGNPASASVTYTWREVTADIWVGGIHITDDNMNDVFGDGKVSYDPKTMTLTFSSGRLITNYSWGALVDATMEKSSDTLTIVAPETGRNLKFSAEAAGIAMQRGNLVLQGNITIEASQFGIRAMDGDVTIGGNGKSSITIDAGYFGIRAEKGDVTVCGNSAVSITSKDKGIEASGDVLLSGSGAVTVTSTLGGIEASGSVTVSGDTALTLEANKTGIKAKGAVTLASGGEVKITSPITCIDAEGLVTLSGAGNVTIKSNSDMAVLAKAGAVLSGSGVLTITAEEDGIDAWGNVVISGSGRVVISAEYYGIYAVDHDVIIGGSGEVDISGGYAILLTGRANQVLLNGAATPITLRAMPGNQAVLNTATNGSPVAGKNFDKYAVYGDPASTSVSYVLESILSNVWVNGVQVSNINQDDVLEDGTVSFNPVTATLTLNGAHITRIGSYGAIVADGDLIVNVIGNSRIELDSTQPGYCIYTTGSLTLTGPKDLEICNERVEFDAINATGSVTVKMGGDLIIVSEDDGIYASASGIRGDVILAGAGNVSISTRADAVNAEGTVSITGRGTVSMQAGGDCVYAYDGIAFSGIGNVTMNGGNHCLYTGGHIILTGGNVTLTATGYAIELYSPLTVGGSCNLTASSTSGDGILAQSGMTITDSAVVIVNALRSGINVHGNLVFSGTGGSADIYGEQLGVKLEGRSSAVLLEGSASPIALHTRVGYKAVVNTDTQESPVAGSNLARYTVTGAPNTGSVVYTLAQDCGGDRNKCPLSVFTDAPGYSNWAHKGIEFCVREGLMSGTSATTFSPKTAMSRAMLVTVLYRMDGAPGAGSTKFSDVPSGQWYSAAVSWAADKGIVSGVGEGRFNPNGNVTREQIATILYRYAAYKGYNTSRQDNLSGFADSGKVGTWFRDGMKWAVAEGLISGTTQNGKTYLSPQGDATREQVAAILMRFCENVAK